MAKAPQAGRSKTRLCPPLSPVQAAALSAAFLADTVENIAAAGALTAITSYTAYAPLGTEALLTACVGGATRLILADGSLPTPENVVGFGRCLFQAIQTMLADGHHAACVLSSDCPSLPTKSLVDAARLLMEPGDRCVLGPTEDGGYYLLGLKAAHAHVFANITWSTPAVADETRTRARELGLELVELDPWYDVDDGASLNLLLAEQGGYGASKTKAVIERMGIRGLAIV